MERVARQRAAACHEVFMQLAADGLVVRLGRAWLGRPGGLLVDPERDGVGDQLVAFALAGTGRHRGAGVVRRRERLRMFGRGRSARARRNKQPRDPPHDSSMVACSRWRCGSPRCWA